MSPLCFGGFVLNGFWPETRCSLVVSYEGSAYIRGNLDDLRLLLWGNHAEAQA